MEIEVRNLKYTYKGKKILNQLSFCFDSSKIVGITGHGKTLLLEILDLQKRYTGHIYVDQEEIDIQNKKYFQRRIALISQKNVFFTTSVEAEMKFITEYYHLEFCDLEKRMVDALLLVGLNATYLSREIACLSSSEKVLVKFACNLLMNPKIILVDDVFGVLDGNTKRMLLKLLRKLRDAKDRLIVIASNDIDLLYGFTDEILILEDGIVLLQDSTFTTLKNTKLLRQHHMNIPLLVQFTELAKSKKVKLSYHRDILDLIKDVYKHV